MYWSTPQKGLGKYDYSSNQKENKRRDGKTLSSPLRNKTCVKIVVAIFLLIFYVCYSTITCRAFVVTSVRYTSTTQSMLGIHLPKITLVG